jgi:hypothetical protein
VDLNCPSAKPSGFGAVGNPDIYLVAFDPAARVRYEVLTCVTAGSEVYPGSEFEDSRVGCDYSASYAMSHCGPAL